MGSRIIKATVEAPRGRFTIIGPFPGSIGMVHNQTEPPSLTSRGPLEHLVVAIGVTHGQDRTSADKPLDVLKDLADQGRILDTGNHP